MLRVSCAVFSQTLSVNPFHRRNRGKRLTDSQDSGETKRISAAKLKGLEMYIYIYIRPALRRETQSHRIDASSLIL